MERSKSHHLEIYDQSDNEFYKDSQESLNTLFCNTFKGFNGSGFNPSQNTLVTTARDESLATIYNTHEESTNLNKIQNLIQIDQKKQLLFPEGPISNFSDCMSCFQSQPTLLQHRDKALKMRNTPRKGALRQRCQDCGSLLQTFNGLSSESQDYKCEECRNESQDNESIAIKIPMHRTDSRGPFECQMAKTKLNKVTARSHQLMTTRSQPKKLKSFYHEEIEQLQMQFQSERNDDTTRYTQDDIRTNSEESSTTQSHRLKAVINSLGQIEDN